MEKYGEYIRLMSLQISQGEYTKFQLVKNDIFRACIESLKEGQKFTISERKVNIYRGLDVIAVTCTLAELWVAHN